MPKKQTTPIARSAATEHLENRVESAMKYIAELEKMIIKQEMIMASIAKDVRELQQKQRNSYGVV